MSSKETHKKALLTKYISGDISSSEKHDLELLALDDPFLFDSLEGITTIAGNHVKSIEQINQSLHKKNKINRTFLYSIAASLLVIIGFSVWLPYSATNSEMMAGMEEREEPQETIKFEDSKEQAAPKAGDGNKKLAIVEKEAARPQTQNKSASSNDNIRKQLGSSQSENMDELQDNEVIAAKDSYADDQVAENSNIQMPVPSSIPANRPDQVSGESKQTIVREEKSRTEKGAINETESDETESGKMAIEAPILLSQDMQATPAGASREKKNKRKQAQDIYFDAQLTDLINRAISNGELKAIPKGLSITLIVKNEMITRLLINPKQDKNTTVVLELFAKRAFLDKESTTENYVYIYNG